MRKHLEQADFDALREAGYLATGLPVDEGGMFENPYTSTAPICEMLRTIAQGDPSVALVAAMHPTVLIPWLIKDKVPEPHAQAWADQRATLFDGVKEGAWWGTITSEPGSGGDVLRTKTTAKPTEEDGRYLLTGDKHFGSGSCLVSYMITTAVAQDDSTPDLFFLDMRNVPEKGAQISAEWDGHGMAATQSHSWRFDGFPATRIAWPGHVGELAPVSGAFGNCAFTAVIVGVVDAAIGAAREQIAPKRDSLRA